MVAQPVGLRIEIGLQHRGRLPELALAELLEGVAVAPLRDAHDALAVLGDEDTAAQKAGLESDLLGGQPRQVVGMATLRIGRGRIDDQGEERFDQIQGRSADDRPVSGPA